MPIFVAILASAALMIGGLSASARADQSQNPSEPVVERVLVRSGGSANLHIGEFAEGMVGANLVITAKGAWRATQISASVNGQPTTTLMTVGTSARSATLKVPASTERSGTDVRFSSSAASVLLTVVVELSTQSAVVPTGKDRLFHLGKPPTGATSATVSFAGRGAWRDTVVQLIEATGSRQYVFTARKNSSPQTSLVIPLPKDSGGDIRLHSSAASVRVDATVVKYSFDPPVVTPTPTPSGSSPTPTPTPSATPSPTPSPTPTPTPIPSATPSPTPSPTPTPTPSPPSNPGGASRPGPDKTGVPSGISPTAVYGDIRIAKPGTVIDSVIVYGRIWVDAENVTIKNSIIRGGGVLNWPRPGGLINNTAGHPGLLILDSELAPSFLTPNSNGIVGSNFTARRVDVHGAIDSLHILGDNVNVESSWLHDNVHFDRDLNQGGNPSHDDSIQIQAGRNIVMTDNNISGALNSGIQITQGQGPVSDVIFRGNYADGGGCTFNIAEAGGGPIRGIEVTDNVFGRNTRVRDCAVIAKQSSAPLMANNFYTDGQKVTLHRG